MSELLLSPAQSLLARLLARAWHSLFVLSHASWRKDVGEVGRIDTLLAGDSRFFLTFWHGKYLPLFATLRGRRAAVVSSTSFRGSVIARICTLSGYHSIQIDDRGGTRSSGQLRAALAGQQAAALVVDGPLGPYHLVKRGSIRLASELGWPLVPLSVASSPKIVMKERWDRMEVPLPFSRVAVVVGEPIIVPAALDEAGIDACANLVRAAMESLDAAAEERVAGSEGAGSVVGER